MDTPIILLISIAVKWAVDFVKDVTNKNVNGIVTRITAVAAAWVTITAVAHTVWATTLPVLGSISLHSLGGLETLVVAVGVAASGGTIADTLRTFNKSDANVQSKLLPGVDNPEPPVV